MTWTQIRRKWTTLQGKAKGTWSRLSRRELEAVRGLRDRLVDRVQEAYGIARSDAERQVAEFARKAGASLRAASRKAKVKGRRALEKAEGAGRAAAGAALGAAADRLARMRVSVEGGRRRRATSRARSDGKRARSRA
jgi:uncharacterized protein YjbJ (UPF0337 family)